MTDYDNTKKLSGIPPWPVHSHTRKGHPMSSALLDIEEPLWDATNLIRAASMAATAITDGDQRRAMVTLIDTAAAAVEKLHEAWDHALQPKQKSKEHTLTVVPADGAAS